MIQVTINILGLVVSVTAAVLVIWGPYWRLRLAGPKLKLQLVDPRGYLIRYEIPRRYYHVLLSNDRPSYAADECKVLLVDAARRSKDGTIRRRGFAAPLQLTWPYPDLPGHSALQKIGATPVLCDLAFISARGEFGLATYARRDVFDLSLAPEESLQIKLEATSLAGSSDPIFIEFRWKGHWFEGTADMATDLEVREITNPAELFLLAR